MYAAIWSANSALRSIRKDHVVIGTPAATKRSETIAQFMQAASLMFIALDYDQGYYINENTDINGKLTRIPRKALRDSARHALDAPIALANANTFTTDAAWTNGLTYTNVQIAQIANTMAAMLLVYYPRDDGESSTAGVVDWAAVASYAS